MSAADDRPPALGSAAAAAEREALVAALRARGGTATAGDLAASSGLALDRVEALLRDLVHDYESHLDVDEAGRLVYRFDPALRERLRPESPAERRARRRLRVARAARAVVRGVNLGAVALYGWVYGALAIATFIAFGLLGGKVWITEEVIAHRNRFRQARGQPLLRSPAARPWDEGQRATPVAEPILPRLRALSERVLRFVLGPLRPGRDLGSREAAAVAFVRARRGVVVPAEVVALEGGSLDEADRLLTRLLVRHRGEVEVSAAGALVYRFDELALTAAPGADRDAPPPPVWEQPSPRDDRLVRERADWWVPGLGGVNVAAAVTLHVWLLPRLGWTAPWTEALLVWFPLGWTALLAVAAGVRAVAARTARPERDREWARALLLRVILEEGGGGAGRAPAGDAARPRALPLADPRALRSLLSAPETAVPGDAALAAALDDLGHGLAADFVAAEDGSGVHARFPRVAAEQAAAAAARAALAAGHGRPGRIVWSTGALPAGVERADRTD